MLNYNFLNNLKHWSEALWKIEKNMKHKHNDFQESLHENHMDATVWLVEELINNIDNCARQEKLKVLILNSWLGIPLVPLLCENIDIGEITCVDLDKESLDLSKIFHKHYAQEKFVKFNHLCLDVPFAFDELNKVDADIVISINTEQMYPLKELVTRNPLALFACQNSNVIEEMYGINCVQSTEELKEQIGLDELYCEGTKTQTYHSWDGRKEYDRFMVIGSK